MPENSIRKKLNCILLIDDDPATNFLHKLILDQMQITDHIEIAYNGQEAMDYLTHQPDGEDPERKPDPDLIFLDINMPVMDGWEFLDAYQETFEGKRKAIVICMLSTALPKNVEDRLEEKSIPRNNFIEKPLKKGMVFKILETFFPDILEKA